MPLTLQTPDCAPEGAQPASTAGAGLTPEQLAKLADAQCDPLLRWVWPLGALGGLITAWLHFGTPLA